MAKELLEMGADPNGEFYGTGTSPLMVVRSARAARLLLDAGADPNAKNQFNGTPLGWSAHLSPEVAEMLLKAGARPYEVSDEDGRTPLWQAACNGNAGVVSLLLAGGASPAVVASGISALDCARGAGRSERTRRPSPLERKGPYVKDFDRVIRLLEQALAQQPGR